MVSGKIPGWTARRASPTPEDAERPPQGICSRHGAQPSARPTLPAGLRRTPPRPDAAAAAADAARQAAQDAGISLDRADIAVGKARDAFHEREADVAEHQVGEQKRRPPILDLSS